jgi:hypothetical protein
MLDLAIIGATGLILDAPRLAEDRDHDLLSAFRIV